MARAKQEEAGKEKASAAAAAATVNESIICQNQTVNALDLAVRPSVRQCMRACIYVKQFCS